MEGAEVVIAVEDGPMKVVCWVVDAEGHAFWGAYGWKSAVEDFEQRTQSVWDRNEVQFPRLLCELAATQVDLDLEAVAESMDLELADVDDLFDRAHHEWELVKDRQASRI
jgi:hypothetical protein